MQLAMSLVRPVPAAVASALQITIGELNADAGDAAARCSCSP